MHMPYSVHKAYLVHEMDTLIQIKTREPLHEKPYLMLVEHTNNKRRQTFSSGII